MLRYRFIPLFTILILSLISAQGRIIFPHSLHVIDQELECSLCHEGVETSSTVADRFMPTMETCGDCHDVDDDCSMCHGDDDEYLTLSESLKTSGMSFPHVRHLVRINDCFTCHGHLEEDDGEKIFPVWTQKDCKACHTSTKPDSHGDFWISEHGISVNSYALDGCSMCHTQQTCDQCHEFQQIEPRVHEVDFIYNHGFDLRSGAMECTSCHDFARDCQACHNDNNIWPASHNRPEWSNILEGDGGLHGEAAENEPEVCQACHNLESATNSCYSTGCHL